MMNVNDMRNAVEFGVKLNIRAMVRAAANEHWKVVKNAAAVIETLMRVYERKIGAVRIG